ncbi:Alginate lyase [Chitinophaga sp. CF118]|uniref:alginate lyase family protein n=1 Tax=Chitinophaga sp. CF118 TaxID=1884367 RepID=UPI0008EB73D2|nr:alginate lyase family protein [Chitinophaga sp. CF118]SFE44297.1 Alginate lyase [Chitinophaga sp. CF118]
MKMFKLLLLFSICTKVYAAQLPPHTFLIKPAALLSGKQKIEQKDPVMQQALSDLIAAADQSLKNGPYSVVYKEKTPSSGDKHDYMSVAPYWWPDSSKANGLPYIRKDGQTNPERFTIKDASYQNALSEDVYRLGLAWFYTGNEKYATHAVKLLRTWYLDPATRMNPNLNYGQAIPGITEGRGIGLIDMHNLPMLIDGIQLLKNSPAFAPSEYKAIQAWYKQYLNWMRTSPIGLEEANASNNHGTWYDVQQMIIALFTDQPELAKKIVEDQTQKRIDGQLTEDGQQPRELERTLSWHYSLFNLRAFFELALLAENVKVDLWNYESAGKKKLQNAFVWLLPYAEDVKKWEHQQIKPKDDKEFLELAKIAAEKYPTMDLAPLWEHHKDFKNKMFLLTNWDY